MGKSRKFRIAAPTNAAGEALDESEVIDSEQLGVAQPSPLHNAEVPILTHDHRGVALN